MRVRRHPSPATEQRENQTQRRLQLGLYAFALCLDVYALRHSVLYQPKHSLYQIAALDSEFINTVCATLPEDDMFFKVLVERFRSIWASVLWSEESGGETLWDEEGRERPELSSMGTMGWAKRVHELYKAGRPRTHKASDHEERVGKVQGGMCPVYHGRPKGDGCDAVSYYVYELNFCAPSTARPWYGAASHYGIEETVGSIRLKSSATDR